MTDTAGCYYDAAGCLVCPARDAVPAAPQQVITDAQLGWNAGANSVNALSGDVHVVTSVDTLPAGTFFGLKSSRTLVTEPSLIDHGLYVYAVAGHAFLEVHELGKKVGTAQPYTLGQPLEIRRVGRDVTYWVNGVRIAATTARTLGPLLVNACLYAAGDTLP